MTRQQLDLLLRYINLKAKLAAELGSGQYRATPAAADELVEIIAKLEESTDD